MFEVQNTQTTDCGDAAMWKVDTRLKDALREALKYDQGQEVNFEDDFYSVLDPVVKADFENLRKQRATELASYSMSMGTSLHQQEHEEGLHEGHQP